MTGLGYAGLVFAILSLLHFALKMTVVYDVAGDPLGGGDVPTLEAVLFAPIGLTPGLFLVAALRRWMVPYPDLLAGDRMNQSAPRRWLLGPREFGVPDEEEGTNCWSLDHLFLDQDAIPTLVEVKRSSDAHPPRGRRSDARLCGECRCLLAGRHHACQV